MEVVWATTSSRMPMPNLLASSIHGATLPLPPNPECPKLHTLPLPVTPLNKLELKAGTMQAAPSELTVGSIHIHQPSSELASDPIFFVIGNPSSPTSAKGAGSDTH
ncbi:Os06g0615601 [Oryza sativa Japonica Group]|nr:Os06g0615601 [Oryza sativa Japonica Group]